MDDLPDISAIAERYLTAVEQFCDTVRHLSAERQDHRPMPGVWTAREIAFHAAEVDLNLGVRLRRILAENDPPLPGVEFGAWLTAIPRKRMDTQLALDALNANSALHVAIMETLSVAQLARTGRHSEGHSVTARDLCVHMARHLESHIKQIHRVVGSDQRR